MQDDNGLSASNVRFGWTADIIEPCCEVFIASVLDEVGYAVGGIRPRS